MSLYQNLFKMNVCDVLRPCFDYFVLYLSRSMITTILLTFIFTYLAVRLVHFVQRYMKIPTIVIVLLTYALVVF